MNFINETINILKNYENIKKSKTNLEYKYKEIVEELRNIKALDMSGMPKSSITNADDKILNLVYQKETIRRLYNETSQKLSKIEKYLEGISEEEKEILLKSYTTDTTDTEIARDMEFSRQTLNEKRKKTIKKLAVQLWGIGAI